MSEPMLEKIARALMADTEAGMPKFVQQGWEGSTQLAREAMLRRADAVLAAMREPTEAMIDALFAAHLTGKWGYDSRAEAVVEWQAMIDAARFA